MTHSLLDPTGNDAAEREAIAETERPGRWYGDPRADARTLTQDQTDMLIRAELWREHSLLAFDDKVDAELRGILGDPATVAWGVANLRNEFLGPIRTQRGGIDSDPLVRLVAFRAWGERDRRWFKERGVRNGDVVRTVAPATEERGSHIARAWPGEHEFGFAVEAGVPGQMVAVQVYSRASHASRLARFRVSDRLREPVYIGEPSPDALCKKFGFDQLMIEDYIVPRRRVLIAQRAGRRSQAVISGRAALVAVDLSELMERACENLDRCLAGLGAPRGPRTTRERRRDTMLAIQSLATRGGCA